jgi:predicted O-methyltransferase YrrM
MTNTTLNLQTAPGHQILAKAGKKILRPGGRAATEQLFTWANFQPGQTVLELASSFGDSAIALATRYGVRVVGVEKNPDSVARARANVAAAGLTDQVEIVQGDIFHLDQLAGQFNYQFDYVLAEAILTMQSAPGKAKILAGVCDRLKPGGKFLSHELMVQQEDTAVYRDLATAIRVNATPLTPDGWTATCETAGLAVVHRQTGPMGLLNPLKMVRDEGIGTVLQMGWTMLSNPAIRDRIMQMRQVFQRHRDNLGYIALSAERHS